MFYLMISLYLILGVISIMLALKIAELNNDKESLNDFWNGGLLHQTKAILVAPIWFVEELVAGDLFS